MPDPVILGPACGNGHPHGPHDYTRGYTTYHCDGYLHAALPPDEEG
jgi:hypothetical protein